jgi:hypothetical protein
MAPPILTARGRVCARKSGAQAAGRIPKVLGPEEIKNLGKSESPPPKRDGNARAKAPPAGRTRWTTRQPPRRRRPAGRERRPWAHEQVAQGDLSSPARAITVVALSQWGQQAGLAGSAAKRRVLPAKPSDREIPIPALDPARRTLCLGPKNLRASRNSTRPKKEALIAGDLAILKNL